jgi:CBS domain-containing protein
VKDNHSHHACEYFNPVSRLPVVDLENKLIGMISRANIVKVVLEQRRQEDGFVERV